MKVDGVQVDRLQVVEVRPGDTVVCETAGMLTDDQCERIAGLLQKKLGPDVTIVILMGGDTINVLRERKASDAQ